MTCTAKGFIAIVIGMIIVKNFVIRYNIQEHISHRLYHRLYINVVLMLSLVPKLDNCFSTASTARAPVVLVNLTYIVSRANPK
jgi:hypothetical protein